MLSRVCRRLSQWLKNLVKSTVTFGKMRLVLSRVLSRFLLSPPFTTAMETEAQVHTETRRKMYPALVIAVVLMLYGCGTHHYLDDKLRVLRPNRNVVGLGNAGMDGTRHNVGRAVLDALAARLGASGRWKGDRQLCSELAVCELEGERLILLKPKLLMNVNGAAVAKAASKFGVRPEDVLLVHDELDKPLGKIAVKLGGSARGHNGVRSCADCLNTDVMRRLRVGIGRPHGNTAVDRHVLGRFSTDERKVLDTVLLQSVDLLLSLLRPPGGAEGRQARTTQEKPDTAALET